MFEDAVSTSISMFLMIGISFCMVVLPYLIAQVRVNQKELDRRKALAREKELTR